MYLRVNPVRRTVGRLLVAVVTAMLLAAVPTMAVAQTELVAAIAAAVERNGYAIEEGANVDDETIAALAGGADGVALVVLAADSEGTPRDFAAAVLSELDDGSLHTVVVSAPNGFGAASDEYFRADVNSAATEAGGERSVAAAFGTFLSTLGVSVDTSTRAEPVDETGTDGRVDAPTRDTSVPVGGDSSTSSSSSSGGGLSIWPILLIGLLAFGGFSWWSKRKVAKQQEANLEQARKEAKAQMSAIAQMVYDLNDRVTLSSDDELREDFATASGDYQVLVEEIEVADDGPELAALSDRADHLRWQLEVVGAKLDGREPPAPTIRPLPRDEHLDDHDRIPVDSRRRTRARSNTCFFDPRHRSGVVPAAVTVGEDNLQVMICRECSRRLRDGERPEPGMVDVGRRRVPAAVAPLGYGGLGLALAKLFEVRTADMPQGLQFEWDAATEGMPEPGRRPRTEALPPRPSRGRARRRGATRRRTRR